MQTLKYIFISTFLTLSTTSFCQTPTDAFVQINGEVKDGNSGESIPTVLVTLFFNETEYKSVRADLDGKFILFIPKEKIRTDKSFLEFAFYNYETMILKGNLKNVRNLTVELESDKARSLTKEQFEKLCKERYDYFNECGTKDE